MTHWLLTGALSATLLLGCGDDDGEGTAPPAEPEAREPAAPAEPPEPELSEAEQLAAEIAEALGAGSLGEVGEIRFRFVVTQGEERAFEAMHRWNLETERDHVTWTDRELGEVDALVDVQARIACGTIGGEMAAGDQQDLLSEKAYARWVNDAYWLMMPFKLRDPGVELALEEPREHEGKRYQVLRLSFEGVGLTPGDRYWLFVDPETKRIERWEMLLEGREERSATSWTDWREVGPLTLAHDHVADEADRHILFEDVEVLTTPAPSDFQVEGCPDR